MLLSVVIVRRIKPAFMRSSWGFLGTVQWVFLRAFFIVQHERSDQGGPAPAGRREVMLKLHPGNGLKRARRKKCWLLLENRGAVLHVECHLLAPHPRY